jgi:hypothetical protein
MPRVPITASLIHKLSAQETERLVGSGGCEANAQMRLLGCATSRPTDHSDTHADTQCTELIGESGWCLARSEVGRYSGGRGGGSGGSRDRSGLRALAGCPVGVECLPGLKRTTANLRSDRFNVFARLEGPYEQVRSRTLPIALAILFRVRRSRGRLGIGITLYVDGLPSRLKTASCK